MEVRLTKDADKQICLIYKEYLFRIKDGATKRQAKDFSDQTKWPESFLDEFSKADFSETMMELKNAGLIKRYIYGGFMLEDNAVIYMENRFPNGASQVLDWIAKIKNLIPFV